jgi:hypothetical protein
VRVGIKKLAHSAKNNESAEHKVKQMYFLLFTATYLLAVVGLQCMDVSNCLVNGKQNKLVLKKEMVETQE